VEFEQYTGAYLLDFRASETIMPGGGMSTLLHKNSDDCSKQASGSSGPPRTWRRRCTKVLSTDRRVLFCWVGVTGQDDSRWGAA
jgi:hypothetical protein